jgi:hypothetical protein
MLTKMLKRTLIGSAAAFAAVAFAVPAAAQGVEWRLPANDEIRTLIAERSAPRPGQGIVIGVFEKDSVRIVAGGTGAGAAVDANTLFEIGSITKAFTALLLADMTNKREVSLDDPAAKYLPAGHRMPERNGRPITLRDIGAANVSCFRRAIRKSLGQSPATASAPPEESITAAALECDLCYRKPVFPIYPVCTTRRHNGRCNRHWRVEAGCAQPPDARR